MNSNFRYESIIVDIHNKVCTVTLNKPEIKNALVDGMKTELMDFFNKVKDNSDFKSIIITGKGDVFSAGGDLKALADMNALTGRDRLKESQQIVHLMKNLDIPIIAAVNGPAVGAGFSLALASDIILATKTAYFSSAFVKVGLVPDLGAAYFLSQLIGPYLAKQYMFTGQKISVEKAKELSIINESYESDQLINEAQRLGALLAEGPGSTIGLTKQLINRSINEDLDSYLELEATLQGIAFETDDFGEGVKAFFEKRKPDFTS